MPHKPKPTYQQALALAEALGMRPLQAHCHRGLGMLYATTGQREQARTELDGLRDVPIDGHDLLATSDGGSTDAGGRVMTMGKAIQSRCVTKRPNVSHQVAPLLATTPRRKQACLCDVAWV